LTLTFEAGHQAAFGSPRAQRVLAIVEDLVQGLRGSVFSGWLATSKGALRYFTDQTWRQCLEHFVRGEQLFLGTMRAGWEIDTVQQYHCFSLLYLGELAELEKRVSIYAREAERRGDRYARVMLATRINAVWLARDDPDGAERDLEEALAAWVPERHGYLLQHWYGLFSRGEIALYRGRPGDGAALVAASERAVRRSLLLRVRLVRVEHTHLVARLAIAQAASSPEARDAHLRAATCAAKSLRRERIPLGRWLAPLLLAGCAEVAGRRDEAASHLQEAVALLEASETWLYATAARRRLGETLGGERGRAHLEAADAWFAQQGVKNPARMTAMLVPGWETGKGRLV
jgi:hypothetical protein